MASKRALKAMERDDWTIVTEMLNKGELSIEDINKLPPTVTHHLHATAISSLLSVSHEGMRP